MALVCVGSVRAAPGATTVAVLLAATWPRPVVLVELDPAGGVLAVRYEVPEQPGLVGLATAMEPAPAPPAVLWGNAQELRGALAAVVAPTSGEVVTRVLGQVAGQLARWLGALGDVDVIADCGRATAGAAAEPVLAAADEVLLVARPRADEAYSVLHRASALGGADRVGVVLVGERPYTPGEIQARLGLRVAGVVADDPRAAGALVQGKAGMARRSALVRSAEAVAGDVAERLGVSPSGPLPAPTARPGAGAAVAGGDRL